MYGTLTDAGNALILGDKLATFIALNNFTTKHIIDFANTLRIHPAIVAGRIRHEKKNWKILNRWSSKRGKVRHLFN